MGFLESAYIFFLDYYREHKLDFTYAYEGVLESLEALRSLHDLPRKMAVLTNKPVRPAQDICAALGLAPYFMEIFGGTVLRRRNRYPTKARFNAEHHQAVGTEEKPPADAVVAETVGVGLHVSRPAFASGAGAVA